MLLWGYYVDVYCLESKIMYVLHILCTYVRSYGFMDGTIYLHIFYIYCVILKINDIGVWVNRVRIMLLCLHSSFGEVLAIIIIGICEHSGVH